MNILILESEVYLSYSIANKLTDMGHTCTMSVKVNDMILENKYDVILFSTSIDETFFSIIQNIYKDSIVILLVSSMNDHVTKNLLNCGASDYILKPFMITQLIDKIEHHIQYKIMKIQCASYENYLTHTVTDVNMNCILTIENYVKYIMKNFQTKFNDTELSKKLGISRKSVWEKRKRYNIHRS